MAEFNAVFSDIFTFSATMRETELNPAIDFGEVTIIDTWGPIYDGPYTVTPATNEQILETERKRTTDDITVEKIPFSETTNEYGTTITLAS